MPQFDNVWYKRRVARDSTASGNEDAASITGSVKASDAEGDVLSYSIVTGVDASKGALTFNTNGTYSFVPALNFNGTVSFTYRAYDGQLYSNAATVTIMVNPVNDAPTITYYANNYLIPEDTYGLSIDLSNTFQDVDGDALTISVVGFGPFAFASYNDVTKQLNIFTVGNLNGFSTITVRASDGSAYVDYPIYVMIMPVNDAPSGTSKTITTSEGVAYTFTQSDFGFLDPYDYPSNNFKAVKLTTLPSTGNLTLNGNPITLAGSFVSVADINSGNLKFQPVPNASGSPYSSFTFQVQDDGGVEPYYYPGGADIDPIARTMTINVTAGSNLSSPQTLRRNTAPASPEIKPKEFKIQASPNPTTSQFTLKLEGVDGKQLMSIRVIDLSGKTLEVRNNLYAGQSLQLGANYRAGMYFIELTQGNERRIVKVVKQPN